MDREKVIKGLECLAQKHEQTANPCSKCDYHDRPNFAFCVVDVATDALALLKEQEEVAPEVEVLNEIDRLYRCPRCYKSFFYEKQKYCDQCGQAVKWD